MFQLIITGIKVKEMLLQNNKKKIMIMILFQSYTLKIKLVYKMIVKVMIIKIIYDNTYIKYTFVK